MVVVRVLHYGLGEKTTVSNIIIIIIIIIMIIMIIIIVTVTLQQSPVDND